MTRCHLPRSLRSEVVFQSVCRTATARERQPGGARHGLTTDDEREAGLERLARSLEDVGLPERNSPMRTVTTLLALVAVFRAASPVLDAQAHIRRGGAFTDSTGRTVLYRYWTRSDWNMSEPRGVLMYFHGNSRGTADDLRRIEWPALLQALDLGLAVAVVAAPASDGTRTPADLFGYDMDSSGTRVWRAKPDSRLIHELLQSGFNSELAVDHDRVIFMGGSQGTCFLALFLEQYAAVYGGGFHAWCGCFWGKSYDVPPRSYDPWTPAYQWTPFGASHVSERLRVFVEATTDDFLHSDAVDMEKYYSELLDLDTRSDLEEPGGHCWSGATPWPVVWEWLSAVPVPERSGGAGDADGDGVDDAVDPDDDNDGLPDATDPDPLRGTRLDQLAFRRVETGVAYVYESSSPRHPAASVHGAKPASVIYPEPRGTRQSYQFIELGDGANPRFEIMIDRLDRDEPCEAVLLAELCDPETKQFLYFEDYIDWIYIDRNQNQNVTDDGPPLVRAGNTHDVFSSPRVHTVLDVPYASGDVLPYGILLSTWDDPGRGAFYMGAGTWIGHVQPPFGERVLVATVDANFDGLFDTGGPPDDFDGPVRDLRDITCVDLDRNGLLNECEQTEDYTGERVNPVYPGQPFELDGRRYRISVAPSGHRITWLTVTPPVAVGTLPDRGLVLGSTLHVDVSRAFTDPDGDALTYTASSSAPEVVTASTAEARLTLTTVALGTAAIRVTATDPAGLGRFRWTDPVLLAGGTRVRLVHLMELRFAVVAVE